MKIDLYKEFRERVVAKGDSFFSNILINPISIRIAYFIKRKNINVVPDYIALSRPLFFVPLIIISLLMAPILGLKIFYLFVAILFYLFLFSDWLDGQVARGLNKVSERGAFLDSVGDRFALPMFFLLMFSVGVFSNNSFLIYGSLILFILKIAQLSLINMAFFHGVYDTEVFVAQSALRKTGMPQATAFITKIAHKFGVKNNNVVGQFERYVIMLIIIPILFFANQDFIVQLILVVLLIVYFIFFIFNIGRIFKKIQGGKTK